MSPGSKALLAGFSGSGKTSYLAALWHLLESREVETSLVAAELQPDREYLNRIRDNWLKFQEVGRTSLRGQETVSLPLQDKEGRTKIALLLPDFSGELFRLQWATRKATREYADFANSASGVLLFIHSSTVRQALRIPIKETAQDEQSEPPSNIRDWSHDLAPVQVQLVELLQFATHLRSAAEPLRVGVLISAWDLVSGQIPPSSWLETHLPLLFQFLTSNADITPFCTYGISALGGDLEKDLQRLKDESVPSRRIRVVEDKQKPHRDLTIPIRFLLELDHGRSQITEDSER